MNLSRISGAYTVALWDNMKGNDTGEYWKVAQKAQFNADIVIYPNYSILNEMPILPKKYTVLGNPTLEGWNKVIP